MGAISSKNNEQGRRRSSSNGIEFDEDTYKKLKEEDKNIIIQFPNPDFSDSVTPPTEDTPLIASENTQTQTLLEKKQSICHSIINEKALIPGLWQALASAVILLGAAYLAYSTGPSFLHWATLGKHLIPGNDRVNSYIAPWAAESVNVVLNFVVLVQVLFHLFVQYWNYYILKRQHRIKPKLGRDLALLVPTLMNTIFAALPFGALVLYKGDIKAFIEQMIVFSGMLGLGSFAIVMLAIFLAYRVYSLVSTPCQKEVFTEKPDEKDIAFERNLKLVQICPEVFLEEPEVLNTQKNDSSADLLARINSAGGKLEGYYGRLLNWQDSRWRWWLMVLLISTLAAPWAVSLIGYFSLTKNDAVTAILKMFNSPKVGSESRIILGSVLFSPFISFSIFYSIKNTVNALMGYAEHLIYERVQKYLNVQKPQLKNNYWHNALYAIGGGLTLIVLGGYFMAYEAAASSLALNSQKAGVHDLYTSIGTCIGSMIFNGYGVFTLAVLLYWAAKLLFTYGAKKGLEVFRLNQAATFFQSHEGDLQHQSVEKTQMACLV